MKFCCLLKNTKIPSRLVNMNLMLRKALDNHYAVAQININNLEWIIAALIAAQKSNSPIILGVSSGAAKYMQGFKNVVNMVNNVMDKLDIKVPVALHLDHGSYEDAVECLKCGFSSIMFDGSKFPIQENIDKTNKLLKLAKKYNASVEAEVGSIGGNEDGKTASGTLSNKNECKKMFDETHYLCCLAPGIGNIHGIYPSNWKGLNFNLLIDIFNAIGRKPLVLHGGTGIPYDQIKNAINFGICKINVNTECQLAFASAIRKYILDKKDLDKKNKGFDPRKLLKSGSDAIIQTCIEKFKMFGSINKA